VRACVGGVVPRVHRANQLARRRKPARQLPFPTDCREGASSHGPRGESRKRALTSRAEPRKARERETGQQVRVQMIMNAPAARLSLSFAPSLSGNAPRTHTPRTPSRTTTHTAPHQSTPPTRLSTRNYPGISLRVPIRDQTPPGTPKPRPPHAETFFTPSPRHSRSTLQTQFQSVSQSLTSVRDQKFAPRPTPPTPHPPSL